MDRTLEVGPSYTLWDSTYACVYYIDFCMYPSLVQFELSKHFSGICMPEVFENLLHRSTLYK